jgi:hypothetical protein
MKRLLLTTALLAAVGATPVRAADSALTIWNTANPGGAESANGTGGASILSSNLGGVTVSVSSVQRGINPNDLTEANISIDNTTGTIQTIKIIAGANGYVGPSDLFTLTGAIGATLGGSELMGQFFTDQGNTLNGNSSLAVTGTQIGSFDSGALTGPESFAFNGSGISSLLTPYGLAEELTLTLAPGATVFIQGMSMDANAVPEPSTWVMMGGGFAILGLLGLRKRRVPRFAV